jgi:cell division septal protein FtsQ
VAKKRKKRLDLGVFASRIIANKLILIWLLCVIVAGGVFYGLWYFFYNSQFFTIKEVEVSKEETYSYWVGRRRKAKRALYRQKHV